MDEQPDSRGWRRMRRVEPPKRTLRQRLALLACLFRPAPPPHPHPHYDPRSHSDYPEH